MILISDNWNLLAKSYVMCNNFTDNIMKIWTGKSLTTNHNHYRCRERLITVYYHYIIINNNSKNDLVVFLRLIIFTITIWCLEDCPTHLLIRSYVVLWRAPKTLINIIIYNTFYLSILIVILKTLCFSFLVV